MTKTKFKPKQKKVPNQASITKLADVLNIEFKKIVPLIPLPDGSVAYKDYVVRQDKQGGWSIYNKRTGNDVHGQFNLRTCALIAAKALSLVHLDKYNEIKLLDNKYWNNHYRSMVYEHNIKQTKEYERYLILLNKLEDSSWKASQYKEEISKLFRWSFV